jgi:hypothetical protein
MADTVTILVDFEKMASNFSLGEGHKVTVNECREFLVEAGIVDEGHNQWVGEEMSLSALDVTEYKVLKSS